MSQEWLLPEEFTDNDFEDYVSALLQVSRMFVERNVKMDNTLELDVIVTELSQNESPSTTIVEVKSGDWGLEDVFKLKGWMDFIGVNKGLFIYSTRRKKEISEEVKRRFMELGVQLRCLPQTLSEFEKAIQILCNEEHVTVDEKDVKIWMITQRIERKLMNFLSSLRKHPGKKSSLLENFKAISSNTNEHAELLHEYYRMIKDKVFFLNENFEKLKELCRECQKGKYRVSEQCVSDHSKNQSEKTGGIPEELFERTFYDCEFNILQISTYIEHMARLSILKTAVGLMLCKNWKDSYEDDESIPKSFYGGLCTLENESYSFLYPVFWQWFLLVFGGFILRDRENEEFEILSKKTKVPVEGIRKALEVYDRFFPKFYGSEPKPWFVDLSNELKLVSLFSCVFQGVGVYYRTLLYGKPGDVKSLGISDRRTLDYLEKCYHLAETVFNSKD
uniref:Uncharacterized protein n=1 Tax=Fervidobacterium pennivorans TaxID=93466 RepID=A0A7C4W6X4_FERPE